MRHDDPAGQASADVLSSGRDPGLRRRSRWRRPVLAAAVLATAVAAAAAAGPSAPPGQDEASSAPAGDLELAAAPRPAVLAAPVCPPSTIADATGGEYGVQIKADIDSLVLRNGWDEAQKLWYATTTGITAKACGVLMLPSLKVVIKPDGLVFDSDPHHVNVTLIGGALAAFTVGLEPSGDAASTITGVAPDGALELGVSTPLTLKLTKGLEFGGDPFNCIVPVSTGLTTGTSKVVPPGRGDQPTDDWTVTGAPLTGPFVGAHATVVGNDFVIPEFPTDEFTSPGCTQGLFINIPFGGQKADGSGPYYQAGADTPAGESHVEGTLTITDIDEGAIGFGPPTLVPGT